MHVGFSVPYDQRENFECSLQTLALGRTCLIGSVFTAFFFKDAASEILCNLEQQRRGWQNHANFSHGYAVRTDSSFGNSFGDRSMPTGKCVVGVVARNGKRGSIDLRKKNNEFLSSSSFQF